MVSTGTIPLWEHLHFINNIPPQKVYLKVGNMGVINFTLLSRGTVELGLHKNPTLHGVGRALMEAALEYAREELRAERVVVRVFTRNRRALKLYREYNFTTQKEEGEMAIMELKL
ncbi:MAG: hypothetical protein C6I05_01910 [Epsilonproteobacteria bacterium]|nr:hypothetical protein [Campylobacterota bacterium]